MGSVTGQMNPAIEAQFVSEPGGSRGSTVLGCGDIYRWRQNPFVVGSGYVFFLHFDALLRPEGPQKAFGQVSSQLCLFLSVASYTIPLPRKH